MLAHRTFYFLRHGQTDWNQAGRYQGQQDIPLNATGLAQAESAKALLRGHPIATVCCSPLVRARQTAEILNEVLKAPLIVIDELKECSYGELEGQLKSGPEIDSQWRRGITPPGAETYEAFTARVLQGLETALGHPGPVLIVAHRAVYWPIEVYARLSGDDLPNAHPVRLDPPGNHLGGHAGAWSAKLL